MADDTLVLTCEDLSNAIIPFLPGTEMGRATATFYQSYDS